MFLVVFFGTFSVLVILRLKINIRDQVHFLIFPAELSKHRVKSYITLKLVVR